MRVKVNTSQKLIGSEYPGLPGYKLVERTASKSVYKKYNALMGIGSYLEFDHATKEVTVGKLQDVQPIIDRNKELQNSFSGYRGKEMFQTASVPLVVDAELKKKSGLNTRTGEYDQQKYTSILNDGDYKYLRTIPGKI